MNTLPRKLLAEAIGTMLLLVTIVGSAIVGTKLAQGNDAVASLANASAVGAMFYVLLTILGPICGAHLNPTVTIAVRLRGETTTSEAAAYILVQVVAAIAGVLLAHVLFGLDMIEPGTHVHTGITQWLSESVATFGLIFTILLGSARAPKAVPALVATYLFAASWFTPSGGFANPAVTIARALTQTPSGIRPEDVLAFVGAQLVGMLVAVAVGGVLLPERGTAPASSN